jgi:outer membrane protein assembly factor BamB
MLSLSSYSRKAKKLSFVGILSGLIALSGCSSNEVDESLQPAELIDFTPTVNAKVVWERWAGDGADEQLLRLVPAVSGDAVFACDADGDCYAYDRHSGARLWSQDVDLHISGAIAAGSGVVAFGTIDGQLVVLNDSDGSERFRKQLTSEILSSPAIHNNMLVVQAQNGHVFAFDLESETQKWHYDATLPLLSIRGTASPVVNDEATFVAFANGKVVALSNDNGATLWEKRISTPSGKSDLEKLSDVDGTPLLDYETLYAVGFNGVLRSIDVYSGRTRWKKEASSYVGPAQGFGQVYVAKDDGELIAVDDRSSAVNWKIEDLKNRQLTRPVVLGNYVVVGDFEGYLHFISQLSGTFSERINIDRDGLMSDPIVVGDTLYIYSSDGSLAAVKIEEES